jgi:hypothetical protein
MHFPNVYFIYDTANQETCGFQALTANFLGGCARRFLISFKVLIPLSCLESARRIARVFFGLRSRGLYFLFFKNRMKYKFYNNTKKRYSTCIHLISRMHKKTLVDTDLKKFPQILLLLLMHHNIYSSNCFSHNSTRGKKKKTKHLVFSFITYIMY